MKLSILLLQALILFSCSKNIEKTIYISDSLVDCDGDSKQKCLQIKEDENGEWMSFSNSINGFDFQEGFNYKLSVILEEIDNPSAGSPTYEYTLLKILDKKTNYKSILKKGSWMVNIIGDEKEFFRKPWINFDVKNNRIHGSTSCNKFFGSYKIIGNQILFETIGSTKMACPDMSIEDLFLRTLNKVKYFEIIDHTLHFLTDDNLLIMKLENIEDQT